VNDCLVFCQMSKSLLKDLDGSKGFDCSAFLCHKLQWPANNCPNEQWRSGPNTSKYSSVNQGDIKATDRKDHAMPQKGANTAGKFLDGDYYEREYQTLVDWMDEEDNIVAAPSQQADRRNEIQKLSRLADEALSKEFPSANLPLNDYNIRFSGSENLAKEVAIKAIETPREVNEKSNSVMSPEGFKNFVEEQLVGFGDKPMKVTRGEVRRRRLCRHFVKGFCLRGSSCFFLHDPSIFCCDEQKVFLGGLPLHLTTAMLISKLEEKGLSVLNRPRIMRGFTPQVCLGSVKEAEKLVAQQYIYICDQRVDVRPYQEEGKLRQTFPSVVKRSVFLGGLPEKTTANMIIKDLERLDITVEVVPVVKNGYAPRVVIASLKDAKMLVALKRVVVNGAVVDVRPYVNFRKRY